MGRRRGRARSLLVAAAGAGAVMATITRGAWAVERPAQEIRGDDAPPCRGAACDPSPPTSPAVPPPEALNLACGMQSTGLECRLSSAAIPACSAAANEEFEQVVREQAGARVDPTLTPTSRPGIAFRDRNGATPAYAWKPAFSTKKTYCGTVLDVEPSTSGSFWGPANDERIRVLASAGFRSVGSVAASLAGGPEAYLVSAVTQP